MLEGLTGQDVLGLLAATAAMFFYLGRITARTSTEDRAQRERLERQSAEEALARLPPTSRTEIDGLIAAGKIIEAVKAVRAATGLGLYEAKQIVDLRKSQRPVG